MRCPLAPGRPGASLCRFLVKPTALCSAAGLKEDHLLQGKSYEHTPQPWVSRAHAQLSLAAAEKPASFSLLLWNLVQLSASSHSAFSGPNKLSRSAGLSAWEQAFFSCLHSTDLQKRSTECPGVRTRRLKATVKNPAPEQGLH